MLRLRGNSPATVDDKGRLKLPTSFKAAFDGYSKGQALEALRFYLTSWDGSSARLYPLPVWEAIEARLDQLPSQHPAKRKFLEITAYYGSEVDLDAQGRFVIPGILREAASLVGGEVAILGQVDHLAIWNRQRFETKSQAEPLTQSDFEALAELGI